MGHVAMKPRQRVSKSGIELIKRFEGYRSSAARLADGGWTMGYGHVKFAKEGAEVTEKDAEALLVYDLIEVSSAISDLVFTPLTQNQFDALTSFAFNIGVKRFTGSSVLRRINEGEMAKAAFAIEVWRMTEFEGVPIVVDALIRRRAAEKALFLTPDEGFIPAPTPILPPEIDYAVEGRAPVSEPANLITRFDGVVAEAYRGPKTALVNPPKPPFAEPQAEEPPPVSAHPEIVPAQSEGAEQEADAGALESAPSAPLVPEPPAPEPKPAEPPRPAPIPARALAKVARPVAKPKSLLLPIAFSVAGVLLFGFAIFWGLNNGSVPEARGANGHALSYLAGIIGVICIFAAAYMILDRFAGDED